MMQWVESIIAMTCLFIDFALGVWIAKNLWGDKT